MLGYNKKYFFKPNYFPLLKYIDFIVTLKFIN